MTNRKGCSSETKEGVVKAGKSLGSPLQELSSSSSWHPQKWIFFLFWLRRVPSIGLFMVSQDHGLRLNMTKAELAIEKPISH